VTPDELIRASYAAWSGGDRDALLALYHPDCVWSQEGWDGWPDRPVYEGHAGMAEIFGSLRGVFETLDVAPAEIVEATEGRRFVLGTISARGHSSGATVGMPPFGQLVSFRDGLIARVDNYTDVARARRLAGLMG
jgi:ketosteroid isomerase-like protein